MKKVLAWAVALALVLSSFTMAFAADTKTSADFSDADQIHYTEAVDVMVATGIINGFPDGTFGPQKTVKRSEMAKMIACIMNGGEDVGDQFKSACPFADSKDHWAAGYIAYCASEHIIDGRSADVFDPEATVTGTEVAKMALTSLGYDSKIQGYTGENWAAAVLKDAKKNDLFKDLDKSFVPGNPCDRESAAQILFNMLKATEVEYSSSATVTTGDGTTVTVASSVQPVTKTVTENDETKEVPVSLYEDVFGGDLAKDDAKGDDFGNPGHTWTYPDTETEVGTYLDSADYEFVAEATGTWSDILAEYDEDLADAYDDPDEAFTITTVTINGNEQGSVGGIGLGDTVKLYETSTDDVYKAVVEQYKAYQITEVNTEDITAKQEKKGVTALVTFQYEGNDVANLTNVQDIDIVGYDASTYVEDAVVAIALKSNGKTIIDSFVMDELASGEITKINNKSGAVTIGGTAYDKATNFNKVDGKDFDVESKVTLYDYNGYALASVEVAPPEEELFYGMLTAVGQEQSAFDDGADLVKIFTSEGKEEVFTLEDDFDMTQIPTKNVDGTTVVDVPFLISYEKNEDGEISKITKADPTTGWNTTSVKTGDVFNGRELSADVVAFAKEDDEWVVYDIDDLRAADSIAATYYIDNKDDDVVAMYCGGLKESSTVIGFLSEVTSIKNSDGQAYELKAYVNGEEKEYTTVAGTNAPTNAQSKLYHLVILTFDGDLVESIENAPCSSITNGDDEFADPIKAVFYYGKNDGPKTSIADVIYKVVDISGNTLNVGVNTVDENDKQLVTADADVYYVTLTDGQITKAEISEFGKIKKDNYVVLMKLDKDSSTWDTVLFTDSNVPAYVNMATETPSGTGE